MILRRMANEFETIGNALGEVETCRQWQIGAAQLRFVASVTDNIESVSIPPLAQQWLEAGRARRVPASARLRREGRKHSQRGLRDETAHSVHGNGAGVLGHPRVRCGLVRGQDCRLAFQF